MKRCSFVVVLTIIFNAYLCSQTEENETIKVDTVTRVDTIVVEQQEKKDFKKYDFYNDYLPNLPKINDTLAIENSKKISIISAEFEFSLYLLGGSVSWDISSIRGNTTFGFKCFVGRSGLGANRPIIPCFGPVLGYVTSKSDNIILKFNICTNLWLVNNYTSTEFSLELYEEI
jgi:hypothetical protein